MTEDLIQVLDDDREEERFRSFATQHLWQTSRTASGEELERIKQKLRAALNDRHVKVRREHCWRCTAEAIRWPTLPR